MHFIMLELFKTQHVDGQLMMLYAPESNQDQERINQFRKELGLHPFGLTIDYKSTVDSKAVFSGADSIFLTETGLQAQHSQGKTTYHHHY